MATGTNVPFPTFGPTGFVAPLESDVLAGVIADFQAAFGNKLNFTTNAGAPINATPQGQLASSIAAVQGVNNDTFLLFTNLVDPALSYGRMQDAIGRIYYVVRIPAQPTVFQGNVIGVGNTDILAGFTCTDQDGNTFTTLADVTIPTNGPIEASFTATAPGPTPVPTSITSFQAVPGVDAIQVVGGTVGSNVETPQQFEVRRFNSVGWRSVGPLGSILGGVLAVPGVVDAYVTDNSTGNPETIGEITLPSPCLYVCVVGGLAADVAQAIWTRKIPGCPYYTGAGSTTETVFDTNPQYAPPLPSYPVSFVYAEALGFVVSATFLSTSQLPSNYAALTKTAVVDCFAGLAQVGWTQNGQPLYSSRAKIGSVVLSSYIAEAVRFLGPWAQLVSVKIGSTDSPDAVFNGNISNGSGGAGTILTVNTVTSGTILVGGTVFDTTGAVQPGTVIQSQLSGTTGGVGTYSVSASQLVANEAMSSVSALSTEVHVGINQTPSINAANVSAGTTP